MPANPKQYIESRVYATENRVHPLHSPSPDRKSANVIATTRTPELSHIKQHLSHQSQMPSAQPANSRGFSPREQHFSIRSSRNSSPVRTPTEIFMALSNIKHESPPGRSSPQRTQANRTIVHRYQLKDDHDNTQHRTESPVQRGKLSIEIEPAAGQWQGTSELMGSGELDYLKLLKQKEQTIKQLRDILDLHDRDNPAGGAIDQETKIALLQRKLKEYGKQLRVLQIQNECLISVIQNNQVNIPSKKEEVLQRQIRELRETLASQQSPAGRTDTGRSQQITQQINTVQEHNRFLSQKVRDLELQKASLEVELEKVIRVLKEREGLQHRGSSASSSAHSLQGKAEKEKLTLSKIKEQYSQNLKLARDSFELQHQDLYLRYEGEVQQSNRRIDLLLNSVSKLEDKVKHLQALKKKKTSKAKEQGQGEEIQNLLFEKFNHYKEELDEQKKANALLTRQLSSAHKTLKQLQLKSLDSSRLDEGQATLRERIGGLQGAVSSLEDGKRKLEDLNTRLMSDLEELEKSKNKEVGEIEDKLQTIVGMYQLRLKEEKLFAQHRQTLLAQERDNLQQLNGELQRQNVQLQQEKASKSSEPDIADKIQMVVETYQKEIDIYKNISQQKEKLAEQFGAENGALRQQIEVQKETMGQIEQQSSLNSDALRKKCEYLEQSAQHLNEKNQSLLNSNEQQANAIQSLDVEKQQLQDDKNRLNEELAFMQKFQREASDLRRNLEANNAQFQQSQIRGKQLEGQLINLESRHREEVQDYQRRIAAQEQALDDIKHRLIGETHKLKEIEAKYENQVKAIQKSHSLEPELVKLKDLVADLTQKSQERISVQVLDKYSKLESLYESKITQNQRLQKAVIELRDQLSRGKVELSQAKEKIQSLQRQIQIYQSQSQERKQLYENLLEEKIRIEKSALSEIGESRMQVHSQRAFQEGFASVDGYISSLLELERSHNRQVAQLLQGAPETPGSPDRP